MLWTTISENSNFSVLNACAVALLPNPPILVLGACYKGGASDT